LKIKCPTCPTRHTHRQKAKSEAHHTHQPKTTPTRKEKANEQKQKIQDDGHLVQVQRERRLSRPVRGRRLQRLDFKDTQGEPWNDVYGEADLTVTDGKVTFADPVTRMKGVCMDASFTFDPSAGATVTLVFEDGAELAHRVSIGE